MNNQHFYLLSLSLSFHSAEDRILEKHHKLMGNEAAMKTFSLVLLTNANNTNNKRLLKANYTSCMYSTMSNLHVCNQSQFFFLLKKNKTWLLLFWTDTLYCVQFLKRFFIVCVAKYWASMSCPIVLVNKKMPLIFNYYSELLLPLKKSSIAKDKSFKSMENKSLPKHNINNK